MTDLNCVGAHNAGVKHAPSRLILFARICPTRGLGSRDKYCRDPVHPDYDMANFAKGSRRLHQLSAASVSTSIKMDNRLLNMEFPIGLFQGCNG